MTNKEAIKYLQQFYPHGGHSWLDAQRMEAIKIAIDALQEEPVSEQNLSNVQRIGKNWKEPVSEPQVKESAETQHVNETCKENGYSLTQEPVSEDLEAAIDTYLATYFGGEKEKQEWPFLKKMAIHFANLQKKKDDYAIEIAHMAGEEEGKNIMKQQMMAKAVDGVVHRFNGCGVASVHYNDPNGIPMAYFIPSEGLSAGDKVKIITIKKG